jgi:hypothetical protein
MEPHDLVRRIQDVLRRDPLAPQPSEEGGCVVRRALIGDELGEREGHGLGMELADHGHLLGGAVAASRLGGDLDHDALAEPPAHRTDCGPIAFHLKRMAAVGGAHVQVQDARARFSAARRLIGDLGRRDRQLLMVRLGPARAVRRHHHHERGHAA